MPEVVTNRAVHTGLFIMRQLGLDSPQCTVSVDRLDLHRVHGAACYIFGTALWGEKKQPPRNIKNDPLSRHTDLSKCRGTPSLNVRPAHVARSDCECSAGTRRHSEVNLILFPPHTLGCGALSSLPECAQRKDHSCA